MPGREVSLGEAIQAVCRSKLARVRTAVPGRVVSYDDTKQCADVEVLVNDFFWSEDSPGAPVYEELPVLPNVLVRWPRAGGYVFTMPLGPGDFVWITFSERSLGEFRTKGEKVNPRDLQRHGDWATCTPGCYPDSTPLASGDASARAAGLVIGKDGAETQIRISPTEIKIGATASDFVALSSKVDALFNQLKTDFSSWAVVANDGGAALKAKLVAGFLTLTPNTGATVTKAK